ncbi:MAG: hypothetical protein HC875_03195 [Anaerolineales bacterium]|nr:hypothetical protein [Anaerolineales bacterium]
MTVTAKAGDSSEQREAEAWLINALAEELGINLIKRKWPLENGSWIELDGFCETPLILCEVWAHFGPPKSAQKHKVMMDAFKLLFANDTLFSSQGKCILLFADKDATLHFQGTSWMAQCLKKYNITIKVKELPSELKEKVLMAQERQGRQR